MGDFNQVMKNNPAFLKKFIEDRKKEDEKYFKEHPDSLIIPFLNELRELGFEFEHAPEGSGLETKYKKVIIPIVLKYYAEAKRLKKENERLYFMGYFHCKGADYIVPMLLEDYRFPETTQQILWAISDCLYTIRAMKYVDEYIELVSDKHYGINRQMIILLLGERKVEKAIPVLISLLDDEDVRLHAISALGCFKREEFRPYFERYSGERKAGYGKYARQAIKKLDNLKSKQTN